jgi:pyruvate/2-oxoglutarate/acetoin dehydrogenase E1 component
MVIEATHAADTLVHSGIEAEVIDLRTTRPIDKESYIGIGQQDGPFGSS